jgi:diamine N-acetyltransferase
VEITYIHRRAEFQIIIAPERQGQGLGRAVTQLAIDYAFRVLNLNKLYLTVSTDNQGAIHLYRSCGFIEEGRLVEEYFIDGHYQDALRMFQLQREFIAATGAGG